MNKLKVRSRKPLARRCGGWGAAEYLVVLVVLLLGLWEGAPALLNLIREHYREFSWALMVPF